MLLVMPLRWFLAAVLAAAVHELWHFTALRLCGGVVYGLKIGAGGAVMETDAMSGWRELLCAAAGPIGSFSMLLGAKYWPAAALCALVQGIFNLIPLFPLDGGRVLQCMLKMLYPQISEQTMRSLSIWIILLVGAVWLYAAFTLGMGHLSLICGAFVLVRVYPVKKTLQRTRTGGTIEIH